MKRTEIIDSKIVNWVAQLACFLRQGDIFKKPRGSTHYKFMEFRQEDNLVVCENLDTHAPESIYYNSPVYRLWIL